MIPETMKAVVLMEPTPAENVVLSEVSVPQARPGWVLVKVKAFELNHSEQILRLSEIKADYINKPIIPGIECVGEVADPSDSSFHEGQKVVALMGGDGPQFQRQLCPVCAAADKSCIPRGDGTFLGRGGGSAGNLFHCLGFLV